MGTPNPQTTKRKFSALRNMSSAANLEDRKKTHSHQNSCEESQITREKIREFLAIKSIKVVNLSSRKNRNGEGQIAIKPRENSQPSGKPNADFPALVKMEWRISSC